MTADPGPPDFATLLDWVEGRLEPGVAAEVARQVVAGDARTLGIVAWLRQFHDMARELPLHEPPPLVRQRLQQYFDRWSGARATLTGEPIDTWEPIELRAILLFDSRRDVVTSSVRTADLADDVVHLAYTAELADLVIDVRRLGSRRVRLDGQVLLAEPSTAPVFEAAVRDGGLAARTVDGDELGRFSFADVPETVRHLWVSNGEIAIEADLDLEAERS
jgi:hypothetical protein